MKYFLPLLLLIFSSNCSEEMPTKTPAAVNAIADLKYGSKDKNTMDIFLPNEKSITPAKLLVLIHGGSWSRGDKKELHGYAEQFRKQLPNYAVVTMNYRLLGQDTSTFMLPHQIDDITAALSYLKTNSVKYNLEKEFVLCGVSAGGHLALLYDSKYDTQNEVKKVINVVGPTNFSDPYFLKLTQFHALVPQFVQPQLLPARTNILQYASPVSWVSQNTSPTISFYGNADPMIPQTQSDTLKKKLDHFEIKNEFHYYQGKHNISQIFQKEIIEKAVHFIQD